MRKPETSAYKLLVIFAINYEAILSIFSFIVTGMVVY